MGATTFRMNFYGIPQTLRADVEETFKTTSVKNRDLAFRMLSQHPDDEDFDAELDTWPLRIETCD